MKKVLVGGLIIICAFMLYQARFSSPSLNNSVVSSVNSYEFKGNIYIGREDYLKGLKNVKDNDVLILNQTYISNPNFRIYDSYKITNIEDMNYILNYLLEYEKNHPSKWERSINSMRNEWIAHNLAYRFDINSKRAKDLDLDNDDENKYLIFG